MTFFFIVLVLYCFTRIYLSFRQITFLNKQKIAIPTYLLGTIGNNEYQQTIEKAINAERRIIKNILSPVLFLFIWFYSGALNYLDSLVRTYNQNEIITGLIFLVLIGLITEALTIILNFIDDIRHAIFKRKIMYVLYGIKYKLKQLFYGLLLNIIIIIPLLWIMYETGNGWWVNAWILIMCTLIISALIYPHFIMPLFKDIKDVENTEVLNGINDLHKKSKFPKTKVYSYYAENSSFKNAFITGLGEIKSIFLSESLIKSLLPKQVVAIYSHELGHSVNYHIEKSLFLSGITTFFGFYFLSNLIEKDWFYNSLGIETPSKYIALQIFIMISPIFSFFLLPLQSQWLKKQEYEADNHAVSLVGKHEFIESLVVLHKNNGKLFSNDNIYSLFYDSHPSLIERIKVIQPS